MPTFPWVAVDADFEGQIEHSWGSQLQPGAAATP